MTAKSDLLIEELVSAAIAFGRGHLPDWQTRIEKARQELKAYIEGLEPRWIPVSERLPEIDDGDIKDYDVVYRGTVMVAKWSWDDFDKTQRRWFDCDSDELFLRDITEYVTHWRERPTPPEVQE